MAAEQKPSDASEGNPWTFYDFSLDVPDVNASLVLIDVDTNGPELALHEGYGALKLPDLEAFQYGPLETIPAEIELIHSERDNDSEDLDDTDFWTTDLTPPVITRKARTWENFWEKNHTEPVLFLSEASEAVWNAAWKRFEQGDGTITTRDAVKHDVVVQSLIDLGLGLQSSLFSFDTAGQAHTRGNFTFSGLSHSLTVNIVKAIGGCGENYRAISDLVESIRCNTKSSRSLTAVASATTRIVNTTRKQILNQSAGIATILQVQAVFRTPSMLLTKLRATVGTILACKSEVAVIDCVIELVERHEVIDEWFRPLALQILVLVTKPFLEQISQCIGLLPADLSVQHKSTVLQQLLGCDVSSGRTITDSVNVSGLFDNVQAHALAMTCQSLDLLKTHHPRHSLLFPRSLTLASITGLQLGTTWDDIERIHRQLNTATTDINAGLDKISAAVVNEIESATNAQMFDFNPYSSNVGALQQNILRSAEMLNTTIGFENEQEDDLSEVTWNVLSNEFAAKNNSPMLPFQMLKMESFSPLLMAQSRIVNGACLDMVFKDHGLLHNLDTLYEFHLVGSGVFGTKLKEALFSTDLSSTERKKGYHRAGQLGLRLGSRSTWPPASAELRLALASILTECYRTSYPKHNFEVVGDLPGGLAFAIRNLSEPEIEACTNPQSLAALDFLRLQYQPPKALGSVIAESTLEKYDHIFRFLLRLSRVAFAVNQMWLKQRNSSYDPGRTLTRYIHETHYFVTQLTAYVHTSIATTWTRFRHIITTIESQLDKSHNINIFHLRALHDLTLDKITSDLLLRHRHEKARQALDEALTSVLQLTFTTDIQHAQSVFSEFRAQRTVFVSACQHLVERGNQKQQTSAILPVELRKAWDDGVSSVDGLQSLVLGLDFNENYSMR